MRTVPDDQLRDRFPGRITGTIGPEGLVSPAELVAIVGHTPEELRATDGAYEIRGIEQPGERIDLTASFGSSSRCSRCCSSARWWCSSRW